MRIKFLSIIASFIFVSLAVSSCLDSDNQSMELSSDVTVHAFGIDTIYGKHYKFTIDQLNRLIYNQDSLPVGSDTVIDRILIDTFLVSGWITAGINDTVFVSTDSVDLTPALTTDRLTGLPSSSKGMTFKVHAQADALPGSGATREYTLRINRHNLEPDSLVWNLQGTSPAVGEQKALLFNNDLWLFTQTAAYKTSTSPEEYGWENAPAYAGFPENAKLETIVCFKREEAPGNAIKESLYVVTDDNRTYSSEDGTSWSETSWEGVNGIQTIIASFPNTLTLVTVDAKLYAATCNEEVWSVEEGEISGEGFLPETFIPPISRPTVFRKLW